MKCKVVFVYRFTNLINDKVYIGSTNNPKERLHLHKQHSKTKSNLFYRAIRKYGWILFTEMTVIEECCPLIRNERENYWIQYYDSMNPSKGYNLKLADNSSPTQETRDKISKANKGKKWTDKQKETFKEWHVDGMLGKRHTEETKKKLSDIKSGEKHHFFGKNHTEETKKKMSDASKGRVISSETREKIKNSLLGEKSPRFGKENSEYQKRRASEANKGKVVSDMSKEKNRKAHLGKKFTDEHKNKISTANSGKNNAMYGKTISAEAQERRLKTLKETNRRKREEKAKINRSKVKKLF